MSDEPFYPDMVLRLSAAFHRTAEKQATVDDLSLGLRLYDSLRAQGFMLFVMPKPEVKP